MAHRWPNQGQMASKSSPKCIQEKSPLPMRNSECGCSVEPVDRANRRTAPTLHDPFAGAPGPPCFLRGERDRPGRRSQRLVANISASGEDTECCGRDARAPTNRPSKMIFSGNRIPVRQYPARLDFRVQGIAGGSVLKFEFRQHAHHRRVVGAQTFLRQTQLESFALARAGQVAA